MTGEAATLVDFEHLHYLVPEVILITFTAIRPASAAEFN